MVERRGLMWCLAEIPRAVNASLGKDVNLSPDNIQQSFPFKPTLSLVHVLNDWLLTSRKDFAIISTFYTNTPFRYPNTVSPLSHELIFL